MKTALGILLLVAFANGFPLAFKEHQRYTFNYQTDVVHSFPGAARRQVGLRLNCKCHVTIVRRSEPAEAQIKLEDVRLDQITTEQHSRKFTKLNVDKEAIQMLEKNPIELVFSRSGRVSSIRVSKEEPEWCLNIKRGIANLLQVAPKSHDLDTKQILTTKTPIVIAQEEQTIVGNCPVTYTVEPWVIKDQKTLQEEHVNKVTKSIQYERCANRPTLKENIFLGQLCPSCNMSLGYVPFLRQAGQIEHIMKDRYLMEAKAQEHHIITPYAELSGHVEANVWQRLWFESEKKQDNVELLKDPVQSSLQMKIVHPEDEMRQNKNYKQGIKQKIVELMQQLASEVQKDISSHLVPKIITEMVAHLRLCDTETLEEFLQQTLKHPNQQVRELCVDALSLAGTKECAQLLKKIVDEKKTAEIPLPLLNRMLTNLVFIPEVTPEHVDIVLEVCQKTPELQPQDRLPERRQCYLTYSALVYRLSQRQDAQQRSDIQTSLQNCVQQLQTMWRKAQSVDEKLCFIKAMGNAGQQQHKKIILQQLQDISQPMVLRVECVWALRRMIHTQQRDALTMKLIEIFHDLQQHPELRMAIVELLLDRQPSFMNMQLFLNAVIREIQSKGPRSNQVASWVISKLSSMAYYDNIILKHRASRARRCLSSARRYLNQAVFGVEYSKAMRLAVYSEKIMAGFELEMNKMNVPESYMPRNMNARLMMHMMGQRFEVIQGGVRIEGVKDVVQDLLSHIRSRQRRSVWSTVWDYFSGQPSKPDSSEQFTGQPTGQPTGQSTRKFTGKPTGQPTGQPDSLIDDGDDFMSGMRSDDKSAQSTRRPTATTGRPTQQPTGRPSQKPETPKKPEIAMFMKVFGQEVKFARITPSLVQQLSRQLVDLILEKKNEVQTALGAIKISKDSIIISQKITKAFLAIHSRQMEPTLAGLPLHHHTVATLVTRFEADIKITAQPSWWHIMSAKDLKTSFDVKPTASVNIQSFLKVHTPFVRVGLKAQNNIIAKQNLNLQMDGKPGQSYTFKIQVPTQKTVNNIISPDPTDPKAVGVCGIVEHLQMKKYNMQQKEVVLKLSQDSMVELPNTCYFFEPFSGVATCLRGKVPSLSSLRFSDVPVFPFIQQTNYFVEYVPKEQVKQLVIQFNVNQQQKNTGNIIFRTVGQPQRLMIVNYNYNTKQNKLAFQVTKNQGVPSITEKASLDIDFNGVKDIEATLKNEQYTWTLKNKIVSYGRRMTTEFKWNKLPKVWQQTLQQYEPQILYFIQNFASISTDKRTQQRIKFTFHLLSQVTSRVDVDSPVGEVQSKVMPLPVCVRRFPQSLQQIMQSYYSQCKITSLRNSDQKLLKIFDQKSYSLKAPKSPCQHILLQDKHQKLVKIAVESRSQGQMDLVIQLQHQQRQTTVVVKHDQSILINNKPIQRDSVQLRDIQVTKQKHQVTVTLNAKHYIHVKYQPSNIQILASPTLRNQLRGLCGDNNGESYQEYKSPENKVLSSFDDFAQSWRSQC